MEENNNENNSFDSLGDINAFESQNNEEKSLFGSDMDLPSDETSSDSALDSMFSDDSSSMFNSGADNFNENSKNIEDSKLNNEETFETSDIKENSSFEEENIQYSNDIQNLDSNKDIDSIQDTDFNNIDNNISNPIESIAPEIVSDDEETYKPDELITVRPVKFQQFEASPPVLSIKKNLDIMQDVLMHISVELGRTKSSIKEVMDLEKGSIVELDKIAGEQVEIYVNEKLVAKGEVIVIEDKFGVRVVSTSIKNPNQTYD